MNPVIWLVVGAFLGWLTSLEMSPVGRHERIVNVVAGAGGALAAGWLLSYFGWDAVPSGELSLGSLVEAAFGAIVLLTLVNLIKLIRIP